MNRNNQLLKKILSLLLIGVVFSPLSAFSNSEWVLIAVGDISILIPLNNNTGAQNVTYEYDVLGRLILYTDLPTGDTQEYSYDDAGNRLSVETITDQ